MAEETNSILMDPPAMTEEQKKLVSVVAGYQRKNTWFKKRN
jgi:hypothetical protein